MLRYKPSQWLVCFPFLAVNKLADYIWLCTQLLATRQLADYDFRLLKGIKISNQSTGIHQLRRTTFFRYYYILVENNKYPPLTTDPFTILLKN